jgi:hypothetical protein
MGNIHSAHDIKFVLTPKRTAVQLLQKAEDLDNYVSDCMDSPLNLAARERCVYAANEPTSNEIEHLQQYLAVVHKQLPIRLRRELGTVNIICMMPSADGGMPHTRPNNLICCPHISQIYSVKTLVHELWHLHQRKYEHLWFNVFNNLGWDLWDENELPYELERHRRLNPDTVDCPLWIFKDTWVPVPIFTHSTHPVLSEVEIWFYNPKERRHIKSIPYDIIEIFSNRLPASAYENPREITAYMLSDPELYMNVPAFKRLVVMLGHSAVLTEE